MHQDITKIKTTPIQGMIQGTLSGLMSLKHAPSGKFLPEDQKRSPCLHLSSASSQPPLKTAESLSAQ